MNGHTFVACADATIVNGAQVWFKIVTDDGRQLDIDVSLYPDVDGRVGFWSRFGLPTDSIVLSEAQHIDDIEALLAPQAVPNQAQQVKYAHGHLLRLRLALMPEVQRKAARS